MVEVEAGVDIGALGTAALVPFTVRRLRTPSLIWVNLAWFARHGVDVSDPARRRSIDQWLLTDFAFCVHEKENADGFTDEERVVHADRYGCGSGSSSHGGSGRVATIGCYQVKGVGPTPLARGVTEEGYAHGCLWLEEAIREAMLAEIADSEFPHGAVPIIAIIASNLSVGQDGPSKQHRVLAVRPAIIRPAHFERASIFASRGGRAEVVQDVARTRSAIALLRDEASRQMAGIGVSSFDEFIRRSMEQVGFGHAHRLTHGGYFSSNMGIDGELHDFGSFRALPDWASSRATAESPPFGAESSSLGAMLESHRFYERKFFAAADVPGGSPGRMLDVGIGEARMAAFADALGLERSSALACELCRLLDSEFIGQQGMQRDLEADDQGSAASLEDDLVTAGARIGAAGGLATEIVKAVRAGVRNADISIEEADRAWAALLRFARPRPFAYRSILQGTIFRFVDAIARGDRGIADELMCFLLSRCRRYWTGLGEFTIQGQTVTASGSWLWLANAGGAPGLVAIEGAMVDRRLVSFGQSVDCTGNEVIQGRSGRVLALFDAPPDIHGGGEVASRCGERISLPPLEYQFLVAHFPS